MSCFKKNRRHLIITINRLIPNSKIQGVYAQPGLKIFQSHYFTEKRLIINKMSYRITILKIEEYQIKYSFHLSKLSDTDKIRFI